MKINDIYCKGDLYVFDDCFSDEELRKIWTELNFLRESFKLLPSTLSGASETNDGLIKKTGYGVFLENVYLNTSLSDLAVLTHQKLFEGKFVDELCSLNKHFKYLRLVNYATTLVNYYDHGQAYDRHFDYSVFTAVFCFCLDESKFSGGDLMFPELSITIPPKNNRLIIFPGYEDPMVSKMDMEEGARVLGGFGRYGVTKFLLVERSFHD